MRILVLGTGLQGRATLHDLAGSPAVSHVIAADADLAGLIRYLDRLKAPKIEPVELDEVHEFYSYGAGFPEPGAATGPLRYKISWTFEGVLKSYVRDARVIREGKTVAIPGREIFAPSNIHMRRTSGTWR